MSDDEDEREMRVSKMFESELRRFVYGLPLEAGRRKSRENPSIGTVLAMYVQKTRKRRKVPIDGPIRDFKFESHAPSKVIDALVNLKEPPKPVVTRPSKVPSTESIFIPSTPNHVLIPSTPNPMVQFEYEEDEPY